MNDPHPDHPAATRPGRFSLALLPGLRGLHGRRGLRAAAAGLGLSLALALGAAGTVHALESAQAAVLQLPDAAAVQAQDLDWQDEARSRAVPVRLYWPAQAAAGAPVPLVVFSHGIGGSRRGYSYLGQYFAAQGIASLHVQHVGSDRGLWLGNPFTLVGRLQGAAQEGEALARVQDLRFALDQLLAGPWGARIDRQRIAAAGHSYGANTVMLATGARVLRDGQPLALRDDRIKAALLLSAPPFYGLGDPAPIVQPVSLPTLHVTATEDVIRIPGYYSGADDRVALFDAMGSSAKALAVFQGGSHSIFTDRLVTGGTELNPKVKDATRTLAVAFLRQVFDGLPDALAQWPQAHRELLARWTLRAPAAAGS